MRCRSAVSFLLGVVLAASVWPGARGQTPRVRFTYDTPLACVEALHAGLISASSDQGPGGLAQPYDRLAPLIASTHDLHYIAEFTTRCHWAGFEDEGREVFVQRFERLSVITYASRFVALSEDSFAIEISRGLDSGRTQIVASIKREAQPGIPLEYLLHEDETGWWIINVVTDGVSDLTLKRAEYQRVLSEGPLADLLEVLDEQIAAL